MKSIWKNQQYILNLAWSVNKRRIGIEFFLMLSNVIYTVLNMFFWKYILDAIVKKETYVRILFYIVIYSIVYILVIWFQNITKSTWLPETELNYVKYFNLQIYEKAYKMDLEKYESKEFYDKFVWISENIAVQCSKMISNLFSFWENVSILTIMVGISISLEPMLILLNLLYVLLSSFLKTHIAYLNVDYKKEITYIARKQEYAKRVCYLPQYAQEIRTFSQLSDMIQKIYEESVVQQKDSIKKYGRKISIFYMIINISRYILSSYLPYLFLGAKAILTKSYSVGTFNLLTDTAIGLKDSIEGVFDIVSKIQESNKYIQDYRDFIDHKTNIKENIEGKKANTGANTLEIRNLYFSYGNKSNFVLKNINMKIEAGEKIAIVGHNGAGKSTLTKLMMHLYEPCSGKILMDGIDIREYRLSSYRERFATVFQDFKLYAVSLKENVIMGKSDGTREEKECVEDALSKSGVWEKIASQGKTIETMMTKEFDDDGLVLSGGESQKIALARAFYKDAGIIILDEPSSAMDPISEYKMNQNMMVAAKGKTVIMISHRLSTVIDADRIYYFEKGEIEEQGTHKELMKQNGKYAAMFRLQADAYKEKKYY